MAWILLLYMWLLISTWNIKENILLYNWIKLIRDSDATNNN